MCVHKQRYVRDIQLDNSLEDNCEYVDVDKAIESDSSDLTILQLNIRGLNSKIGDLNQLINSVQSNGHPDILLLCESWLKSTSPKPTLEGYNIERSDRKWKKGGGVCTFVSSRCKYSRRPDLEALNCNSFESCFIEIQSWNLKLVIGSVYRPPNSDSREFNSIFHKVCTNAKQHERKLLLGLDHNLDLRKESRHNPTHEFIEAVYENGMIPTITKPTRITTSSATLIDNILLDQRLCHASNSGILINDISDHLPCFCILNNVYPNRKEDLVITSRDTRPKNLNALKGRLSDPALLKPDISASVDDQFNKFHSKLCEEIDHFLPIRTRKIPHRRRRQEPWVTSGLLISMNKCKKLYKLHIKDRRNQVKLEKYTTYNQELKRIKRRAKLNYYTTRCAENKSNSRKLWGTINEVIRKSNNKTEVIEKLKIDDLYEYNGQRISEEFAKYFATIGKSYANNMSKPKTDLKNYLNQIPTQQKSLFLNPTTEQEISRLIDKLPAKKSSGLDGLDNIILKEIKTHITGPLCVIFNKSLETGIFPERMKTAKVVPLYKNKSKHLTTNYRPISLLITISKVLEKVVYSRVYSFLTSTKQLYSSQYGFRKGHACEHAVGELIARITKGIEQDKLTASVFLDLSKAFDSLEHAAILHKLEKYGIRGTCLNWFQSYLHNRKLSVTCKTADTGECTTSSEHEIDYGTAQGSCLGPLIFLVFCNDLQQHLMFLECIQFADDTTLYVTHKNIDYIRFCLEYDLCTLQDWFRANKLTLNVSKSVCILFGKQKNLHLNIKIDQETIPQVQYTKFLGLWIDQDLNWKEHTSKLLLKLKSKSNLLMAGKRFLSTHALRILYFAQIHSNLSYGISMWGSLLTKENSKKLQKLQDKCMLAVGRGLGPKVSLDKTYSDHKILKIEQLIDFELCKLWHKKQLDLLPCKLSEAMSCDQWDQSLQKLHRYPTRQKNLPNRPKATHHEYLNSFLVKGNRVYSQLHQDIRGCTTLRQFANRLKENLQN